MADINKTSLEAAKKGLLDKEKYVIPPHLHDLQEADLPETQRGLVMTEIAQFRERSAKREREKMRDLKQGMPVLGAPSGPKMREWGKPQNQIQGSPQSGKAVGKGPQSYDKPIGFVKAGESPVSDERGLAGRTNKSDEELEAERKEARRKDEEASFRDVSFPSCLFTNQHCTSTALLNVANHLFHLFRSTNRGNVDMSLGNVSESKPWSALWQGNEPCKRQRIVIGLRCDRALTSGMTMKATNSFIQIGTPPSSSFFYDVD